MFVNVRIKLTAFSILCKRFTWFSMAVTLKLEKRVDTYFINCAL